MGGAKRIELKKGDMVFREGDHPDSAYLVQSGRIAIVKSKGSGEVTLAELGPGTMLGEMSIFDCKPRSAGARALDHKTVIVDLPLKALRAQLKTAPQWMKSIFQTINKHLREANKRIKNLEKNQAHEDMLFDPYTINRLISLLVLVTTRFGKKEKEGYVVPTGTLRRYTIQIFQQPTMKMAKLTEVLCELGYAKSEKLGEGKQRLMISDPKMLSDLVDYYNDYLFTAEEERINISEKDLSALKALAYYAKKKGGDRSGAPVEVSLNEMQNDSMRLLGCLIKIEDVNGLIENELCGEKVMAGDDLLCAVDYKKVAPIIKYWTVIFALQKLRK